MEQRHPLVTALLGATIAAAGCTAPPQVQADLEMPREALLTAMRDAAAYPVPLPPQLYVLDGAFRDLEFGSVVAIDGPMIAIRLPSPDPRDLYFHCVVPIQDRAHGIKGDGIVVTKCGDLLVCRYFENRFGSHLALQLGDGAWVDRVTSEALRKAVVAGTTAWFPASPSHR